MTPADPTTPELPAPRRRRRARLALGIALACLGAALLTGSVGLETPWGIRVAANLALRLTRPLPGATLDVGGARGGFLTGIELHDLTVRFPAKHFAARVETIRVAYSLAELLGNGIRVRSILLAGADIEASLRPGDELVSAQPGRKPSKPKPFGIDRVTVRRFSLDASVPPIGRDSLFRIEALALGAERVRLEGARAEVTLDSLGAWLELPAAPAARFRLVARGGISDRSVSLSRLTLDGTRSHLAAQGTLAFPDSASPAFEGTDLRITALPLAGADVSRFVAGVTLPEDASIDAHVRAAEDVEGTIAARFTRGGRVELSARGRLAGGRPVRLRVKGRASGIDPAWLGGAPGPGRTYASIDIDVRGSELRHLDGPFGLAAGDVPAGGTNLDRITLEGRFDDGRATFHASAASGEFGLAAAGYARPFDPRPKYDIEADSNLPPIRLGDAARRSPVLLAGRVGVRLAGEGVRPSDANAKLAVRLAADERQGPLVGPGRFDVSIANGAAIWTGELTAASGSVRASGLVRLDSIPSWSVREGEIAGVNFAALVGDSAASRLDARFTAEGRGFRPDAARATATVEPLTAAYGAHRVEQAYLRLEVRDGRARLGAAAVLDSAGLDARATLGPLGAPARDATLDLRFRSLDLSRVLADTTFASDLAGRLEIALHASDLGALFSAPSRRASPPPATRGTMRFALEPSRWRSERVAALELTGNLDGASATFDGRLESSFGRARLRGAAKPFGRAPAAALDAAELEALDLGPMLGIAGLTTRLQGTLGGRIERLDSTTFAVSSRANLDGSRIGAVTLDRLRLDGTLDSDRLDLVVGARSVSDSFAFTATGRPFADTASFHAIGRVATEDLGAWIGADTLRAGGHFEFDASASLPRGAGFESATGSFSLSGDARVGAGRVDTLQLALDLRDGLARIERGVIRGNVLAANATGQIAIPGGRSAEPTRLRVDGVLRPMDPGESYFPSHTLGAAGGRAWLEASGSADSMRFAAALSATRLRFDGTWADSVALDVSGGFADTRLESADARLHMSAVAIGMTPTRDVTSHARWDGAELSVEASSRIENSRDQELAFRLRPERTRTWLRIERLKLQGAHNLAELRQPAEIEFGDRLQVSDIVILQNGVPRMFLNGGIGPGGTDSLTFRADSTDLANIIELLGIPALSGTVSATAVLAGTPSKPVLSASGRSTLRSAGSPPARVRARARWADGQLNAEAEFVQTPGQRLATRVTLPLTLDLARMTVTGRPDSIAVTLLAQHFDLAWFQPFVPVQTARNIRGWLDGRAEASGVLGYPMLSGSMALSRGRVEVPALGARFDKAEIELGFEGRTMRIRKGGISSGEGRVEFGGQATFEGPGRRTFDFRSDWKRFRVVNTSLAVAEISGALGATGTPSAPRISGKLTMLNSTFYAEGGSERAVEEVELTEADRRALEERFATATNGSARPRTARDSLSADISLAIGKNVWVRRRSDPVLALEMTGDMRAEKLPGTPLRVSGKLGVETGRSYLSFLGRKFDMTHAAIDLPGPIDSVSAEMEAQYIPTGSSSSSSSAPTVTANVSVNAQDTKVDLRSEPYMERSKLMSYIATGQTEGEMASGSAYGLAMGAALGAVGGAAGRSLGFQVVNVTQDAYGSQVLSAGNYVDPRLYLGFRQPVVESQTQSSRTSGTTYSTEFEVEVEAMDRLLLNVQGGGSQYRFLLRPRLKR